MPRAQRDRLGGAAATTAVADELWAECEPVDRSALLRVLMARWVAARDLGGQGR